MIIETVLSLAMGFPFTVQVQDSKAPALLHKRGEEYTLVLSYEFIESVTEEGLLFTFYHEQAHIEHNHFAQVKSGTPLYDVELEADRVAVGKLKERLVCPLDAVKTVVQYRGWFDSTHPSRFTLTKLARGLK